MFVLTAPLGPSQQLPLERASGFVLDLGLLFLTDLCHSPPRRWGSSSMLVLVSGGRGAIARGVYVLPVAGSVAGIEDSGPPGDKFVCIVFYDHTL